MVSKADKILVFINGLLLPGSGSKKDHGGHSLFCKALCCTKSSHRLQFKPVRLRVETTAPMPQRRREERIHTDHGRYPEPSSRVDSLESRRNHTFFFWQP